MLDTQVLPHKCYKKGIYVPHVVNQGMLGKKSVYDLSPKVESSHIIISFYKAVHFISEVKILIYICCI